MFVNKVKTLVLCSLPAAFVILLGSMFVYAVTYPLSSSPLTESVPQSHLQCIIEPSEKCTEIGDKFYATGAYEKAYPFYTVSCPMSDNPDAYRNAESCSAAGTILILNSDLANAFNYFVMACTLGHATSCDAAKQIHSVMKQKPTL